MVKDIRNCAHVQPSIDGVNYRTAGWYAKTGFDLCCGVWEQGGHNITRHNADAGKPTGQFSNSSMILLVSRAVRPVNHSGLFGKYSGSSLQM